MSYIKIKELDWLIIVFAISFFYVNIMMFKHYTTFWLNNYLTNTPMQLIPIYLYLIEGLFFTGSMLFINYKMNYYNYVKYEIKTK